MNVLDVFLLFQFFPNNIQILNTLIILLFNPQFKARTKYINFKDKEKARILLIEQIIYIYII
jgi:hypothetical protein